jgi:hypothetical protein
MFVIFVTILKNVLLVFGSVCFMHKKRQLRLSPAQRNQIAARQNYKCDTCQTPLPVNFDVDHIVALCDGGADAHVNLHALCVQCHADKTRGFDNKVRSYFKTPVFQCQCPRCGIYFSPFFTHKC